MNLREHVADMSERLAPRARTFWQRAQGAWRALRGDPEALGFGSGPGASARADGGAGGAGAGGGAGAQQASLHPLALQGEVMDLTRAMRHFDPTVAFEKGGGGSGGGDEAGGRGGNIIDEPRALYWDPFSLVQQLGYRDKPSAVTYATLQSMVWRVPIVQALIQTRVNQISAFATPQRSRFETGFRVKMRDPEEKPSAADKRFIRKMEDRLLYSGVDTGDVRGRESFDNFLRKLVRDTLTYDQMNVEVVPDRMGRPARWIPVDAATIRLADTQKLYPDDDPEAVYAVQIYDNVIIAEFTRQELSFGVRNPRTDIRTAGYGTSELEMIVSTVTAVLWAWHYNQNFFCIAPGTLVATRCGQEPIETLADTRFDVWNGREYRPARAFKTGSRMVVRTLLWNGLELETSPDHRFRVLRDESMSPLWVKQSELERDDTVLVDIRRGGPEAVDEAALFVGRTYETDRETGTAFTPTSALVHDARFWEWVGFTLGDGYWPRPEDRPCVLQTFPHYARDAALFPRFLETLDQHGIHAALKQVNKTKARADGAFGYPAIHVYQRAFVEWLKDLGFASSTTGKRIPARFFRQPAWMREALLRGIFSADGHTRTHTTGYRTPTVYAEDRALRQDILRCLFSVGIAANNVGDGWERSGEIVVQDVPTFVERVGYLQAYKQRGVRRSAKSKSRWDKLRPSYSRQLANALMDHRGSALKLTPAEASYLRKAAAGRFVMSRPRALALCQKLEVVPKEAMFYHHAPVDGVEMPKLGRVVDMYDVEVFDDEHVFLANGVAVHNSQGTVAKGLLNLVGAIPEKQLRAFRRQWYQMVSGIENAWRTPITNAEKVEWINMTQSNRDMEFSAWMDFLIKVVCATYAMDPIEINFKYGSGGGAKSMFEGAQRAKAQESRERGLKPLLRFIGREIDRYIIWPTDPGFTLEFVGLEAQTPKELADLMTQRVRTMYTIDELRAENDYEPLPDGLGNIILDANWLNARNAAIADQKEKEAQAAAFGAGVGPDGHPISGGSGAPGAPSAPGVGALSGGPGSGALGGPGGGGAAGGAGGAGAGAGGGGGGGGGDPLGALDQLLSRISKKPAPPKPTSIPAQTPKDIETELQGVNVEGEGDDKALGDSDLVKSVLEIEL